MAELEKLPEGIWIISCNNLEEGHSMLYRNFQDVPFLIDPNLGLIPLQKDLDDHKNQIGKLLALYAEEHNLTNVTINRLEFNSQL